MNIKKYIMYNIIFSIFCLIFGFIYELYSHNVYSIYMGLSFIIPLLLAILLFIVYKLNIKLNIKSIILLNLLMITITMYSIVKGILDIYGTSNSLINIYLYSSIILVILSITFNFKREY